MKYILIILLCLYGSVQAQTTGYFRYDTIRMQKGGGNSELIIENATKAVTGGVLTNTGGGRTAFVAPAATSFDWKITGNAGTVAGTNFIGTTDAVDFVTKTNSVEQLRYLASGGIRIPTTVDSSIGVVFKGSDRFIHNYQNPATATNLGQSWYIGRKSGNFNFTGASGGFGGRNLAIGDSTLFANTTGYRNVTIGTWTLAANTTGFENTIVGANASQNSTTGRQNTAIGAISLNLITTGFRNTAVGFSALQTGTTAERNTAVGGRAMQLATTAFANTALGFDALAYNSTADHNTAIGMDALYYSNGSHNTAVGDSTLWGLFGLGVSHVGYKNVAIGSRAGYHLGDTYPNYASIFDTAVTFLGANASRDSSIPYTTSLKNMTVIGYNARGSASNQVVLGNNDVTTTLLKGDVGNGTFTPLRKFHNVGTVRLASLGTASTDTTTYKPVGINSSGDVLPMTAWPGGGGGGTPGGLTTQVQFNDAGVFGGDAGMTYNKTTDALTVGSLTASGLTSGRVPYATTAGLITDDDDHTWNATDILLNVNATNASGNIKIGALATSPTYGAIYFGKTTPSTSNWSFLGSTTLTAFNTAFGDQMQFRSGNTTAGYLENYTWAFGYLTPATASTGVTIGTDNATYVKLKVHGATAQSADIFQVTDISSNPYLIVDGTGDVGVRVAAPTARLHIAAGTSAANTGSLKFNDGTVNTTAEAGGREMQGGFYDTKASGLRYALGGNVFDFKADSSNTTTTETDAYTYTMPANTFAADGDKITFTYTVNLNDLTSTAQIKVWAFGSTIGNTGALTVSAIGAVVINGWIIRTSATTVRTSVNISSPGASTAVYTAENDLTGLTLSSAALLKLTLQAAGASPTTGDLVAKMGTIQWWGAAR